MASKHISVLSAAFFSAALLGAASIAVTIPFAEAAHAKGGNDGGNGGGNGNGGRGSEASGKGASAKADRSTSGKAAKSDDATKKRVPQADMTTTSPRPASRKVKLNKTPDLAEVLGAHPSELGALNAANASPRALAKANPKSRVGRIAAYRDAVLGRADLLSDYDLTRAALDAATPPARDPDAISADLTQYDADIDLAAADLAAARAELAVAPVGTDTTALQGEIAALEGEVEAISIERATVRAELDAANDYANLVEEEAELREAIANQPALEQSLLEAAANKTVTPGVVTSVNDLLGLDPVELVIPNAPLAPVVVVPVTE